MAAAIACLITSVVEAGGLCHQLSQIVMFDDVAVSDGAYPLFLNLHPLAQ
jgi:hypothetical protein